MRACRLRFGGSTASSGSSPIRRVFFPARGPNAEIDSDGRAQTVLGFYEGFSTAVKK